MPIKEWGFYGRHHEIEILMDILKRNRWFFLKISGRRRIGKTTLIQQVLKKAGKDKILYIQIPDSDPAGVMATVRDFYEMFNIQGSPPSDLKSFAKDIAVKAEAGYIIAIDEFQYFHRNVLFEFTSHLQLEVDRLAAKAEQVKGGLIVLGSIHTEMSALLEDRSAPLFNRTTDQFDLQHLDIASICEILRVHADENPERLLFLWNLFEGVPKFYRDCFEQQVISEDRKKLLEKMFFTSSSPLKNEADNWFLRELRGRYDLVLKYVARHPGCTNSELDSHARSVDPSSQKQVGGYIKNLSQKYGMIERLQPIFAKPRARKGRFYLKDNFLRSWLHALAIPAASVNFKPIEQLVLDADQRLADAEGYGLERLVWSLYAERSRKGVGDFLLSERIQGYWDKAGTEIDLVALNEEDNIIRLGSCKRNAVKLVSDLSKFDGHINRFLGSFPRFNSWTVEKVAITPRHSMETRKAAEDKGYIPQDLIDLTNGL